MRSEISSGVAISIACFLWQLLEFSLGFHSSRIDYYPFITWLVLIIPITGIYWAVRAKRDRFFEGRINFMQALLTGLKITGVCTVVIPLFSWLYIAVINPLYLTAMYNHHLRLIDSLNLSNDLERESLKTNAIREFSSYSYLVQRFLVTLISGLILSLIIAGVIQKNKPVLPQDK
jgi:hypothetical protein